MRWEKRIPLEDNRNTASGSAEFRSMMKSDPAIRNPADSPFEGVVASRPRPNQPLPPLVAIVRFPIMVFIDA